MAHEVSDDPEIYISGSQTAITRITTVVAMSGIDKLEERVLFPQKKTVGHDFSN
ncbi:hypothetical protein ACP4OV_029399 [Aristida adscensionis]